MYVVDPTNRTTGRARISCQHRASTSDKGKGDDVQARPATENRMKARYPLTVLCAPLSLAFPVAVLHRPPKPNPTPKKVSTQRARDRVSAKHAHNDGRQQGLERGEHARVSVPGHRSHAKGRKGLTFESVQASRT